MEITGAAQKSGNKGPPGAVCFSWGAGSHGQLGQPVVNGQLRSFNSPVSVKFDKLGDSAVRVASGSSHVACITDAGEVWLWGDGRGGQLGYTMLRSNNQPTPLTVTAWEKNPGPICKVACGQYHTLVLDTNGGLHAWGRGNMGQLGVGKSIPSCPFPRTVSFKYKLTQIACGDSHSAAIDDRGKVYTWGTGEAGQLGHGFDKPPQGVPLPEPWLVADLPHHLGRMAHIDCGAQFTAVVSERGEVYLWGFGENLYSTLKENFAYVPERVQLPKKVLEVACGRSHILARTEEQNVYAWGNCDFGQLGHGRKVPTKIPRLVLGAYRSFSEVSTESLALTFTVMVRRRQENCLDLGRSVPLLCAEHLRLLVLVGLRRVWAAGARQRPERSPPQGQRGAPEDGGRHDGLRRALDLHRLLGLVARGDRPADRDLASERARGVRAQAGKTPDYRPLPAGWALVRARAHPSLGVHRMPRRPAPPGSGPRNWPRSSRCGTSCVRCANCFLL